MNPFTSLPILRLIDWKEFLISFRTFVSNRHLIWSFAKRDLTGKYKGSFWEPFGLSSTLLFNDHLYHCLCCFFEIRFGDTGSTFHSTLYILAGIVPWMAFQEAASHSTTVVAENVKPH